MSLKETNIKKAYSSEEDDILNGFYIQALSESIEYNRLAGFFSSTSLAIAARGIIKLIENDGFMKLVISPKLSIQDLDVIKDTFANPEKYIDDKIIKELNQLEDEFILDHVRALGWMLANDKLEIRVAVPYDENNNLLSSTEIEARGMFHPKVGILKDNTGNLISFSGSVNESASGWLYNIEEFKVFRSWEDFELEYLKADLTKFERIWNGQSNKIKIHPISDAVKNKLIRIAPKDIYEIDFKKLYYIHKKNKKINKIELFQHQKDAVKSWLENGMKGIFEMATGTGKTYTSLFAVKEFIKLNPNNYIIVICCPYQHLVDQWELSISNVFDSSNIIKCYHSKNYWYEPLGLIIENIIFNKIKLGIVITTTNTGSNDLFLNLINSPKIKKIVICDEVHNIGTAQFKKFLTINSSAKLGLSATPIRQYDEEGNKAISEYFGKTIYKLDIKKAINMGFLVPYNYFVYFTELRDIEYEEYRNISIRIAQLLNQKDVNEEKLQNLLLMRARIISFAENKLEIFESILKEIKNKKNLLVYTAENPNFFQKTLNILKNKNLTTLKITSDIEKSERTRIINKLEKKDIDCILAMRCLDEGVDIPSADKAIILASSTNQKQYIQRRGRVLRKDLFGKKKWADIYDILVIPPKFDTDIDKQLFERELKRVLEFSSSARNSLQVISEILKFSRNNSLLNEFVKLIMEFCK